MLPIKVSSERTTQCLTSLFARYGLPDQLVSDNGPQFVSHVFKQFTRNNGVKHIRTSPRRPASIGAVERFVRTFKDFFKTRRHDPGDLKQKLDRFLFSYQTMPNTVTGVAPAEIFLKRRLRTRLDLLKPNMSSKVDNRQACNKSLQDEQRKFRDLSVGDNAAVLNFSQRS